MPITGNKYILWNRRAWVAKWWYPSNVGNSEIAKYAERPRKSHGIKFSLSYLDADKEHDQQPTIWIVWAKWTNIENEFDLRLYKYSDHYQLVIATGREINLITVKVTFKSK